MMIILLIVLLSLSLLIAVPFIDSKIVDNLPETNSFKKWWRNHIIAPDPEG